MNVPNMVESMKKLSSKSLPKSPLLQPVDRHVSFLYGDLGLDQRSIARLLQASITSIERSVKKNGLVRHHPPQGEWSERLVHDLAKRLDLKLPSLTGVEPADRWTRLRIAMRGGVSKALARDGAALDKLDAFLGDLPAQLAAAEARLTRPRLGFLHGDLGMEPAAIARLLDASWSGVRRALNGARIDRNQMVHADFNEDLLAVLARTLGRGEWYIDRTSSDGYIRIDRYWTALRKGTGEGLLQLAAEHRLDLAALDQFISMIPKLVAERKARLQGLSPSKKGSRPAPRKAA